MPRFHRAAAASALLGSVVAVTTLVPSPAPRAATVDPVAAIDPLVAPSATPSARVAPPIVATAVAQAQQDQRPPVVARIGAVELRAPSRQTAVAGFHEGSTRSLALEPAGRDDAGPHSADHAHASPSFVVMSSRGRPAASTSAVDLPVAPETALTSPVSGTVVGISQYALYGEVTDWLVEVRPDADPDVVVRIFHLVDPTVEVGQHLEAGASDLAAAARLLPFPSQVDEYTTAPLPHVHVQVDAA